MSEQPWRTRVAVRSYELDRLGHVNHAVYHQYAELARVTGFEAAGCEWAKLVESNIGPVMLSSTINFRHELRAGDEVDVTCELRFGDGKTFRIDSLITKIDGTVCAEITCVLGVMDLEARKLVADPRAALESLGLNATLLPSANFAAREHREGRPR